MTNSLASTRPGASGPVRPEKRSDRIYLLAKAPQAQALAWARAEMGNEAIIADDWDQMGPLGGSRKRLLIWADEESASNDPGQNAIAQLIVEGAIA